MRETVGEAREGVKMKGAVASGRGGPDPSGGHGNRARNLAERQTCPTTSAQLLA